MLPSMDSILRDQCSLDPLRPVLVGVSGGPDSLTLMDVLRQAGYRIIVAHFNHKLRPEADIEANAVEAMAARFGIASVIESANVMTFADEQRLSVEDAARSLRYKFLFSQAHRLGAQAVAVGHTADDQVETVLMHFLRGAGLNGLKGMTYRTMLSNFDADMPVVRPLLDVWREETVVYCASQGLRPHFDPSNDSLNFLRNRIRHLLIPTLETYNPKFREAVWRTAQLLNADHSIVADVIDTSWSKAVVTESAGLVIFDLAVMSGFSVGIQRNLLRRALERVAPRGDITYSIIERASAYISNPKRPSQVILGSNVRLFSEAGQLYVAGQDAVLPFERWPQMPEETDTLPLPAPGQLMLAGGWRFSCEKWGIPALALEQMQGNQDPFQVWLDAEKFKGGLSLRIRRDGDRFEPLGLEGHSQKLSDFFTNNKLPQRARERWPLLCAGEEIAWVPGFQPADPFRLTKASRQIYYFTLTPFRKKAD